jgi:hypothetical protein
MHGVAALYGTRRSKVSPVTMRRLVHFQTSTASDLSGKPVVIMESDSIEDETWQHDLTDRCESSTDGRVPVGDVLNEFTLHEGAVGGSNQDGESLASTSR